MNRVIFRCKRSGNTVSFTSDVEIESMRKHDGYTEVTSEAAVTSTLQTQPAKQEQRRRGRPRQNG